MPWYLKSMLFAALLLAPAHALLLWRAGRAARRGFGLGRGPVAVAAGLSGLVLLACPLVALGAYRLVEAGRWLPASERLLESILYGQPWTDLLLVYPFWFGLIATIQLGPFLLLWELLLWRLPFARLRFSARLSPPVLRARLVILFLALGGLYVIGRMYFDTNHVRVARAEIPIAGLPRELDGLRIAHISDIQADYYTSEAKLERYARTVDALQPDLVVFSGDLITRDPGFVDAGANLLGRLRARHGVFACLGDHDVWYAPGQIRGALRRAGVTLREDGNAFVRHQGRLVALSILTTTYRNRPSAARLRSLARETRGAALRVMVAHQPQAAAVDFARQAGYSLFLGGHTHGGQVAFSYFGWELSASMRETGYVSGLYFRGDLPVHVNNGLGLTFAPVRFQAPAGVALLTLRARAE